MWKCQSGSGTYLNYECQEFLKRKFQDKSMSVERMGYLRKAVDILKQNNNILGSYEEILQEISSYVTNSGVFYSANPRIACSYINYLLNEKLRSKGMHNHTSIYDFFKKFVAEVYKSEKGNYHADKMCDIDIKPLDDDIYDKMTKLYELYNLYDVLKWTLPSRINEECNPYGEMIRIYNNTIKDLKLQDEELIMKLLTLKEMTSKITLPASEICYHRMDHFEEPKLYNDLKKQEQLKKQQQEEAQKAIERQKQEEAQEAIKRQKQEEAKSREQQKEREAQNSLAQVTGSTLGIPENGVLSEPPRVLRTQLLNPEFPRREAHSEDLHFKYPSTHLFGHSIEPKEEFDQPEVKYQASEDDQMAQTNTAGVLGSFQNTISGFIREVDPVPVVGVSGGMGALFLLFRYTPFGTFFRGGRGRAHRIPRSFNGQFLGAFPDFQDYEGGYIGYGPMSMNPLAE